MLSRPSLSARDYSRTFSRCFGKCLGECTLILFTECLKANLSLAPLQTDRHGHQTERSHAKVRSFQLSCPTSKLTLPPKRSLDKSLETTHGQARVFMVCPPVSHALSSLLKPPPLQIVARYCLRSVYEDSLRKCRELFVAEGLTFRLIGRWLTAIWYYRTRDTSIWAAEKWSDIWAARTTIHGRLGA